MKSQIKYSKYLVVFVNQKTVKLTSRKLALMQSDPGTPSIGFRSTLVWSSTEQGYYVTFLLSIENKNNNKHLKVVKKDCKVNLHATMLAYLFLYLFAGFKNCWNENSSSGWTSCRKDQDYKTEYSHAGTSQVT